jgi:hypothetical protein
LGARLGTVRDEGRGAEGRGSEQAGAFAEEPFEAEEEGGEVAEPGMFDVADVQESTLADDFDAALAECPKEMLAASHVQMDETPLPVVAEEGQGTKRGSLWVVRARIGPLGPPAPIEMVLMEFPFSRGKAVPCSPLLYLLECEIISIHTTMRCRAES